MDPEVQGLLAAAAASWPHIHVSDSLAMADRAVAMAAAGCRAIAVLGVDFMSENVRAVLDAAGHTGVPVLRMARERIGCTLADAAEGEAYLSYLRGASRSAGAASSSGDGGNGAGESTSLAAAGDASGRGAAAPPRRGAGGEAAGPARKRQQKSLHVVYINTSLRTKAAADAIVPTITCTSGNVVQTLLQAFAQARASLAAALPPRSARCARVPLQTRQMRRTLHMTCGCCCARSC